MFQMKGFEGNVNFGIVQLFKDCFCRILAKVLFPIQGFGIFFLEVHLDLESNLCQKVEV